MLKALILQVICLYQKVVPHLVSQCKFDFSKLLKGKNEANMTFSTGVTSDSSLNHCPCPV